MALQTKLNILKYLERYAYFKRKIELETEIQKLRTKMIHTKSKKKKIVMKFVKLRRETEKKTNSSEK